MRFMSTALSASLSRAFEFFQNMLLKHRIHALSSRRRLITAQLLRKLTELLSSVRSRNVELKLLKFGVYLFDENQQ